MKELKMLCRDIVDLTAIDDLPVKVTGITSDSRRVAPGDLFVAISGYSDDGHSYVEEAIKKGAVAVIVERPDFQASIPTIRVEDSRKAMALLANRFYGNPSRELQVYGVTGTNGKSTVTVLLESILKRAGEAVGLLGTIRYRWGIHDEMAARTTPDAMELFRMLDEMRRDKIKVVVMEVSSHALALHRVTGIEFRAAIFTNLSRDHLDFHPSYEAYAKEKSRLFENVNDQGIGVINGDDVHHRMMREACKARTVSYGSDSNRLDYRVVKTVPRKTGTRFTMQAPMRRFNFETRLLGRFNVMNAAAAAVLCIETGLDEDAIACGIRQVDRVPGRMENVETGRGYRVIVDYAHTPDALENILRTVREFTERRMLVVFGCGGDRDQGKRPQMGRIAQALADRVFLTSDNPRTEDPEAIISDILKGLESRDDIVVITDRKEAIQAAMDDADEGDTVVVAGKGHEDYQEIGKRRIPFDDRKVVEDYLELK